MFSPFTQVKICEFHFGKQAATESCVIESTCVMQEQNPHELGSIHGWWCSEEWVGSRFLFCQDRMCQPQKA